MPKEFDESLFEDVKYDENLFEDVKYDENLFEEAPEEMGAGEAATRHAVESATFGLSDVATAGVEGAYGEAKDYLSGEGASYQDFLDRYYKSRGEMEASREKGFEDQPLASVAGMIGGGLAVPIPGAGLAKAGKIGKAVSQVLPSMKGVDKIKDLNRAAKLAKKRNLMTSYKQLKMQQYKTGALMGMREGAKAGALMGAVSGETEFLRTGDVSGVIKDAIESGAVGATFGGILGGAVGVGAEVLQNTPVIGNVIDSIYIGLKGKHLNKEFLDKFVTETSEGYRSELNKLFSKLGKTKHRVLDLIGKSGVTLDSEKDVMELMDIAKQLDGDDAPIIVKFLDGLGRFVGEGEEVRKLSKKVNDKIIKEIAKDDFGAAVVKHEKKKFDKLLKTGKSPVSTDYDEVKHADLIPGAPPHSKSVVKHDITEHKVPGGGVEQKHEFSGIDTTGYHPTPIKKGVDPETNLRYASQKDLGTGKTETVIGGKDIAKNLKKLSPGDAEEMRTFLNKYSNIQDSTEALPPELKRKVSALAAKLQSGIYDESGKLGEMAKDVNRQINLLAESKQLAAPSRFYPKPTSRRVRKEDFISDMNDFIIGKGDKNAYKKLSRVTERIAELDPDMAAKIGREIEEIRQRYLLAQLSQSKGMGGIDAILGSIEALGVKVGNFVGRAAAAPISFGKVATDKGVKNLGRVFNNFVKARPEHIQQVISNLKQKGQERFVPALEKALESDERAKQAILYGLMQQPSFRELISSEEE